MQTLSYSGNRLTNLSGITGTYTYDGSGNLTNDPRKKLNFTWNSLNLLKEVNCCNNDGTNLYC